MTVTSWCQVRLHWVRGLPRCWRRRVWPARCWFPRRESDAGAGQGHSARPGQGPLGRPQWPEVSQSESEPGQEGQPETCLAGQVRTAHQDRVSRHRGEPLQQGQLAGPEGLHEERGGGHLRRRSQVSQERGSCGVRPLWWRAESNWQARWHWAERTEDQDYWWLQAIGLYSAIK